MTTQPPGLRSTTEIAFGTEPREAGTSWYLIVSGAGDEPSSRVVTFADPDELVFGRQADCSVVVDHHSVSRRHARFRRRGGQVVVEDVGSTNGTLVNGTVIDGPRRLAAGDVVSIGMATAVLATSTAARERRHVATVTEFEDRLEAEVDRARRYRRPLGLVMLRFTGPTEAMDEFVTAFAPTLRRMDLLAEYSAEELALVLPETGPTAMHSVIERVSKAPAGLSVTTGAATFPADGANDGELISVARERLRGSAPAPGAPRPASIVVIDPKMKHVMTIVQRVAASPITVLVVGETGAGKEVVAEAIHRAGPRARGPFVRLNCAALSEALVESELFGHEKGAFTGAVAAKQGQFELAAGGTLFLDEIGELPAETQAKLLRVLESRKIVRVGGVREIAIDVRIICATHRDLEAEVKRGRFREDLYFRIGAFVIPVPPLRDRRSEIVPLATQFAAQLSPGGATFEPAALALLESYDWPGNVRELRNVIERALVLGGHHIRPADLPERLTASGSGLPSDIHRRVADVERMAVIDALEAADGKQAKAARALGISRFALMRLMDKHGLRKR
ncbi:MAG: sigma 54-interacting transcriptional regulator [Myxococcales bacterium]|nr:sigma 54-interacting transcriptional regulator [Myxococcales bacterium]